MCSANPNVRYGPKADNEVRLVCPGPNLLIGRARIANRSLLPQRNLNAAVYASWRKHEIDVTTELMRNEVADQVGAVAGVVRRCHRWPANLAPFNPQN